jgi:hypothetical protein
MPLVATLRSVGSSYDALQAALAGFAVASRQATLSLQGVGSENPIEAEIQRRQVTRVGAEAGLVGTQNATEIEIYRRIFERVGAEAGLVGSENATMAEIYRRLVTVTVQPGVVDRRAV